MTVFGLIRHGTTHWNVEGRAQGMSDIPLNEQGLNDAKKLAHRLSSNSWDIIYSSDLKRARQTADFISGQVGARVIEDERIREASGGKIEGTTNDERVAKWGKNWRELDLGIEERESVVNRGLSLLNDIKEKHPNDRVLIVSHGSFLRQILHALFEELDDFFHLGNTSVTRLHYINGKWELDLFNCTQHLKEIRNETC